MPSKRLQSALEHRRRIRRALRHIEHALRADPQCWPRLEELAEVACLSPFHFLRLYQQATGETPLAAVRRMKLEAAREALARPGRAVLDVALAHGYESAAAFSRAYRQAFGAAPGRRLPGPEPRQAQLWIAELPALPVQSLAREGGIEDTFDALMACLDAGGVPRFGQDLMAVATPDLRFQRALVASNRWVDAALALQRRAGPSGPHLCIAGTPQAVWQCFERADVQFARDHEAELVQRYVNDPAFCGARNQRIELYLPLVPGRARELQLPA